MSLADLAAVLWRQRELLQDLSYRLTCEQLVLQSGQDALLPRAAQEVHEVMGELTIVELRRAGLADDVAIELGLSHPASLADLAAASSPPWTEVLLSHRDALTDLAWRLQAQAAVNEHLLRNHAETGAGSVALDVDKMARRVG